MDMGRRTYSYIRINRRRLGLTQEELSLLVGLSGAAVVSRTERAKQTPTAHALIGYALVFGMATYELLPSFHRDIEDTIVAAARTLLADYAERDDERARHIRLLLEALITRLTSSDHSRRV
jgi:transcriptional regulator with XRE-family HTH domain